MKRIFNNFLLLTIFLSISFAKTTVAVLEFEGRSISKDEALTLTDRFRSEIIKTNKYIVVERGAMKEILKEQGFQQSGCISNECIVEVGALLGVQQMVGGSIGKIGNLYSISARIIDIETGEIIAVTDYDYEGNIGNLLKYGMKSVVLELVGERKVEVIPPQTGLKTEKMDIPSTFTNEKGKSTQNISYNLKEQAFVTITIYDIVGRKVAQLVNSVQEAGYKSVQWNATDSSGKPVNAGVYTYKLNVGENVEVEKSFILTREIEVN